MKALLTAFALLSFVAASTVPVAAHAATEQSGEAGTKKATKKKVANKKQGSTKKAVAKKKAAKPAQHA